MDRGFEVMLPRNKDEEASEPEFIFNHEIHFSIFGKEFNLSFSVKQKQE
jgi:hypothetical protein|tara:strand:+ start:50 stop:196 length:147 start_codon:yes stop_codon:yes gene_type:complete